MTPNEALGEVIRAARKKENLTQIQLAAALGWGQRKISEIESGAAKKSASLNEVDQIARVLKGDALDMVIDAFKRARAAGTATMEGGS
jgi:transcriptional regulator with XRE-family HTH domain